MLEGQKDIPDSVNTGPTCETQHVEVRWVEGNKGSTLELRDPPHQHPLHPASSSCGE